MPPPLIHPRLTRPNAGCASVARRRLQQLCLYRQGRGTPAPDPPGGPWAARSFPARAGTPPLGICVLPTTRPPGSARLGAGGRFPARSTPWPALGPQGRSQGSREELRRPVAVPVPPVNSNAPPAATATRLLRKGRISPPMRRAVSIFGRRRNVALGGVSPPANRACPAHRQRRARGWRVRHAPSSAFLLPPFYPAMLGIKVELLRLPFSPAESISTLTPALLGWGRGQKGSV